MDDMIKSKPFIQERIAIVRISQDKLASIPEQEIEQRNIKRADEAIVMVSKHQGYSSFKGRKQLRRKASKLTGKQHVKSSRKVSKGATATLKGHKHKSVGAKVNKPLIKPLKRLSKPKRVRAKPSQVSQAYRAGSEAGVQAFMTSPLESNPRLLLNRNYWRWATRNGMKPEGKKYQLEATRYAAGYCKSMRLAAIDWVPLPTERSVAVILSITGNEMNVGKVLNQLHRLPLQELVVVANGVDDDTFAIIHKHPAQPMIVHYDTAIGYDVGRAIGAKITVSDILLFVDGDIVIAAEKLVPFVRVIDQGGSLALNNISPYLGTLSDWDPVTVVKAFVNRTLGRGDLAANSLTAVPHALSRSAVDKIGYSSLAVPPLAQAQMIRAGLQVSAPASVDVISLNRLRPTNQGLGNPVENLIVGDHLEALASVMELSGERIDYPDLMRERSFGEAAP